jgi:hypothetical protein
MEISRGAEVAQIILDQLGNGRLKMMTGASHFVALPNDEKRDGGLAFRLPGGGGFCKDGINYVQIELTYSDVYVVTFSRIRAGVVTEVSKHEEVYCDMLMDVFERATGLYLTLAARR